MVAVDSSVSVVCTVSVCGDVLCVVAVSYDVVVTSVMSDLMWTVDVEVRCEEVECSSVVCRC